MFALIACVVSCAFPPPDEGGRCDVSLDCSDDGSLECVTIDDVGRCLPPIAREPETCSDDNDCFDALFPVEASCVDALCRCEDLSIDNCEEGSFDVFACACLANPSGFCANDEDCDDGLNCEQNQCTRGDEPGDTCSGDEPCEGDLSCICPGADACVVGSCLRDEGGPCVTSDDCNAAFCVNDQCDSDQGTSGDGCADDIDCDLLICNEGTCA